MNCDQARTEIIAYLKGELDSEKVKRLEEHFARCPNCRHELEGARRLLTWTESASEDAVVKKVEELIDNAIKAGASDIHLESQSDNTMIARYRIDGVLHEIERIDSLQRIGVLTRLKMMGEIDVSETSIPQDGRFKWSVGEKNYDVRMSCVPYVFGEGLVMRIVSKGGVLLGLDKLCMYDDQQEIIEKLIRRPMGLIVFSGPTGSGKTTVAYSVLAKLNHPEIKIMTIEDPVEYLIPGVNHCHVNRAAGRTFTKVLRSFLRQDPDVIFAGEIRDLETAEICAEATLTGHLVIATLHTLDAASVVQRFNDMGLPPYLIGATLTGATSQRLVRRVCSSCAEKAEIDTNDPIIKYFGITSDDLVDHTIYHGKGCGECHGTGYKGRLAIYEVLPIDKDLSIKIGNGASTEEIIESARSNGFITMLEDGKRKILDGLTTPEEVFRVLV